MCTISTQIMESYVVISKGHKNVYLHKNLLIHFGWSRFVDEETAATTK